MASFMKVVFFCVVLVLISGIAHVWGDENVTHAYSLSDALGDASGGWFTREPEYMPGTDGGSGSVGNITGMMQKLANGLAGIAAAVAIFFVVLNAFRMVTSIGDADTVSKAKRGLLWSAAGLVLIIFSFVIAKTVLYILYV